tara:strand:- start:549 stop:785 length:237 start_codon:yes stop_codon:yes gene_type:complete
MKSVYEKNKWVSTKEIAEYFEVSEKTLQRWRKIGLLKLGIHWRRKFPTTNRYIVYHFNLTEQAITKYCSQKMEEIKIS